MKRFFRFLATYFLIKGICCFDLSDLIQVNPDFSKNVSELIVSRGYPVEEYTVQTVDGYLLSLQRIPYGKSGPTSNSKRPAVLVQHGVVGDSNQFVWDFPDQSIGYLLADNGYDVWLSNTRGNTYSRRNVRLSPDQEEFWNFSLDEKALIDLPTFIDFILNTTELDSLSYLGYSQGTTLGFALLSRSPEYNKKVNLFAAYAPVAFVRFATGILGLVVRVGFLLEPFYKEIGFVEILPHCKTIELFSKYVCGSPLSPICDVIYYSLFGFDPFQLNHTRIQVYLNQYFAGESVKVVIHFSQLGYAQNFQMYDYGLGNLARYNQLTPPEYDLSQITTPIALFSGLNDIDADPIDVERLRGRLTSIVEDYIIPFPFAQHGDFILAKDAYELIHKRFLEILPNYART